MTTSPPRVGVPKVRVARRRRADLLYRLNRLLLYTVMLAYVPLILAVVAGMVYGAYRLTEFAIYCWTAVGPIALWLVFFAAILDLVVLLGALLLLVGLLPLLFRDVDEAPLGERLDLHRHSNLRLLVQRLCKRLNVRTPDACVLTPGDSAAIADLDLKQDDGRVSKNTRTLMLGAGLVVHTQVDEMATIICHEMAHVATGDTRIGKLAERFYRSMATQIEAHEDDDDHERGWLGFAVYVLLVGYYYLFALMYCADARYREFRADRIAAEICGPQNVRNALIRTYLVGHLPQLSIGKLWQEYCEYEKDISNIYEEHRRRWAGLPAARRQKAENEMFMATSSVWSTHPSLAERVRNLADVSANELSGDQPATGLFHLWNQLEEKTTMRIMRIGREMHRAFLKDLDRQLRRE